MDSQANKIYDVLIIGGGASGTSLLYTLAKYTNIQNIALVEKYSQLAQVNSHSRNNSQSLHVGDIEMHYTRAKATQVKPAALMVPRFVSSLSSKEERNQIMIKVPKMALAVGESEVADMRQRIKEFEGLFPSQQILERNGIEQVEPKITEGRDPDQPILALYDPDGHAVSYQALSESFVREAKKINPNIDILLNTKVLKIKKNTSSYNIITRSNTLNTNVIVVNTDSYSLLFAKSLGYGQEFSLIPIGANFYYSHEVLKGKVYPMQDRKLPFAGVHGDPDINTPHKTRWGPTAKFYPRLESDKWHTIKDYFASASLGRWVAIKSLLGILLDPVRRKYLIKNALYDLPYIGKRLFVKNVQKIVPTLKAKDLTLAKGVGGMRLQRVDTRTGEMQLGEGKIVGDNIIFNMTPSPGASVCLYNAMGDAKKVIEFLRDQFTFDEHQMKQDLT